MFHKSSSRFLISLSAMGVFFGSTPAIAVGSGVITWESQAKSACKRSDFKQFFEAFVRSPEVQAKYSAKKIRVVKDGVGADKTMLKYSDFPIGMIDYNWVTGQSLRNLVAKVDAPFEYITLEMNQVADGRARVDWVRMGYKNGSPNEGEENDTTGPYGKPGYLLFYPTKTGCWELIQDTQGGDADGPSRAKR